MFKLRFEPTTFWATLQGLNHQAMHMMAYDVKKWHGNTYFEPKECIFFYITIWSNWFARFIITLNFVISLVYKYMYIYNYPKYSLIKKKFKIVFWNIELNYIFKYYLLFSYIQLCEFFFHFKMYNKKTIKIFNIFILLNHIMYYLKHNSYLNKTFTFTIGLNSVISFKSQNVKKWWNHLIHKFI